MKSATNESNILINTGINFLITATAPGAFHNSRERFAPPKCDPHTHDDILLILWEWIDGMFDADLSVMWFYGPSGVGKTATAQNIADVCREEGRLLASFFFSRDEPLRDNSEYLFATLAYQIAYYIPAVRGHIEDAIEADPRIFDRSLEAQFKALVVAPLQWIVDIGEVEKFSLPYLIILDGLDECMDGTRAEILDLILGLAKSKKFTFPLLFLVASRCTRDISLVLHSTKVQDIVTRIRLEGDYHSKKTNERYREKKSAKNRETHNSGSFARATDRPNENVKEIPVPKLPKKVSYPTTAVKYLPSPRHRSTQRLEEMSDEDLILVARELGRQYRVPYYD